METGQMKQSDAMTIATPKSDIDLVNMLPKMIENVSVNLMVLSISTVILKGVKDKDPELFYGTKSRLRDMARELGRAHTELTKSLDELQ